MNIVDQILKVVKAAGFAIIDVMKNDVEVFVKADQSPVTIADHLSHQILCKGLKSIIDIPIVSEESSIPPYAERKSWDKYWLIDPLDGTKEFINKQEEFCIIVSLMENNKPVIGVIYAPVTCETHIAVKGLGVQHFNVIRKKIKNLQRPIVVSSRYYHSEKTERFLSANELNQIVTVGAALKFGRMAMGDIDLYPRFQGSSEWDIAAGHLILEESGCVIVDLKTKEEPLYNKESMENNYFFCTRRPYKWDDYLIIETKPSL